MHDPCSLGAEAPARLGEDGSVPETPANEDADRGIQMFSRILVTIDEPGQREVVLDMVRQLATEGVSQVRVLHLRERELSGYAWYAREHRDHASFIAESAIFELRMDGFAAGGGVRSAIVDRVAEAIIDEARTFDADLIVLGMPRRGELKTRLLGSVTMRVLRRSSCPVIVAASRPGQRQPAITSSSAPEHS
jgi:nucleotide-binding universal stress UspA family protein